MLSIRESLTYVVKVVEENNSTIGFCTGANLIVFNIEQVDEY